MNFSSNAAAEKLMGGNFKVKMELNKTRCFLR